MDGLPEPKLIELTDKCFSCDTVLVRRILVRGYTPNVEFRCTSCDVTWWKANNPTYINPQHDFDYPLERQRKPAEQ